MIQQRRVMSIPAILSVRHRAPAAAASAVPWYLAGGAPVPIAAYQPKGVSSLTESKVNLANPGVYDATHVNNLSWDAVNGWNSGGSAYLRTGVIPVNNQTWAMMFRFTGMYDYLQEMIGLTDGAGNAAFSIAPIFYGGVHSVYSGGYLSTAGFVPDGTMAIAGNKFYTNGVQEPGTISVGSGAPFVNDIYILTRNYQNSANGFGSGSIQAVAIWDTSTNHATWMPAVSAAVALI